MTCSRRVSIPILLLLLIVGGAVRYWALPAQYDIRDGDERDYVAGGLDVFQGMPPTLHYAPEGVEAWWGWTHAGFLSAKYVLRPTEEERQVPFQLRPFVAINHALFDLYRDLSGLRREFDLLSLGVGLIAIIAGYRLGMRWAGLHGAVLVGGLLAVVPLLIELGALAKPYSMAWSFALISFFFLVRKNPRPITSAIFLGLAIGSRVEMLTDLPFCWLLLWPVQRSFGRFFRNIVRYTFATIVTALLTAPWLITNLMGNLRAIATIRFAPPTSAAVSHFGMFHLLAIGQGLLFMLLIMAFALIGIWLNGRDDSGQLAIEGVGVPPPTSPAQPAPVASAMLKADADRPFGKFWSWLVLAVGVVFILEILHDTGYGLRHHGPAVIALLAISGLAVAPLARLFPRATWIVIAATLIFPLVKTAKVIMEYRRPYLADDATNWIDSHVPAGATLYLYPTLKDPLPTPASADAAWDEVMRRDAAPRKFQVAAKRFNLADFEPPRGVADQNMMTERGGVRRYYVLGGRSQYAGPRFDIHYTNSSVFGTIKDERLAAFQKTGGVLLWREGNGNDGLAPPELLPLLVKSWTAPGKYGTYIYASPDMKARLSQ